MYSNQALKNTKSTVHPMMIREYATVHLHNLICFNQPLTFLFSFCSCVLQVSWRRRWTLWIWRKASVNSQIIAAVNLPHRPAPYWPSWVTPAKPASCSSRDPSAVWIYRAYSVAYLNDRYFTAQILQSIELASCHLFCKNEGPFLVPVCACVAGNRL